MVSQWWETNVIKKKHRYILGWCPNDEKPNEQRINRDITYDGVLNEKKKKKEHMIKCRKNLGWSPNDDKLKEKTIKLK